MATALQLIRRSMRLIGVIDSRDVPASEESADALVTLNAMLTRWEANGLALGWLNVSATTDTLPIPAEAEEAVAYNLACKLAAEYGKQTPADVMEYARKGLAELIRDRKVEMPLRWECRGGVYDITTDSYR